MSVGDSLIKALRDGGPIGSAFLSAFNPKSDAQKKAEADQKAAMQAAQDQLSFDKAVKTGNDQTVDDALNSIFGGGFGAGSTTPSDSSPYRSLGGGTFGDNGSPLHYGDDNYYGGGTQSGDLSVGGVADNPASGLVVPGQMSANPFQNSNISGIGPGGTGGAAPGGRASNGGLYGQLGGIESSEAQTAQDLANRLNAIQNPDLAAYVGDVNNAASVSPEARTAEMRGMQSLSGMTGVQETAAEKLQRMLAQRQMENQEKGERDAMTANLKSRGVYGAGDELSKQLLSQQGLASTRALQEAAANAGAVNRSLQASSLLGNLGTAVGNQDLNAGSIANQVAESNQSLKEAHNLNDVKTKQQNNKDLAARDATVANSNNYVDQNKRGDVQTGIDTVLKGAGLKTGVALSGAAPVNQGYVNLGQNFRTDAGIAQANDNTGTGYSPL